MPKYELMYIVSAQVADDEIPKLTEEVKKFIEDGAGTIEKIEDLGKRKLAYPIKKTKNGNYVVVNFTADADKIGQIEHRLRTTLSIIRYLLINMDDALERMEKDRMKQSQMKPRRGPEAATPAETKAETTTPQAEKPAGKKVTIDLDAEIEKAIGAEEIK